MSRALGISDEELSALSRYRAARIFDDLEVLVMDLAVAMTSTPAHVTDELRSALEGRVGRTAYAEDHGCRGMGESPGPAEPGSWSSGSWVLRRSILRAARTAQLSQRITVPERSRVSGCG